jgi:hypothetical protein
MAFVIPIKFIVELWNADMLVVYSLPLDHTHDNSNFAIQPAHSNYMYRWWSSKETGTMLGQSGGTRLRVCPPKAADVVSIGKAASQRKNNCGTRRWTVALSRLVKQASLVISMNVPHIPHLDLQPSLTLPAEGANGWPPPVLIDIKVSDAQSLTLKLNDLFREVM